MEIYKLNAIDILKKIKNKEITVEDTVISYLDRIASVDNKIGAFLNVYKDESIKRAKELDKKEINSKIYGIPIGLKDNILLKDTITSSASKILYNYNATYDATVVKKLKEAGSIFIGKTNMDEFAMGSSNENSSIKDVSNPWDITRIPGGSSGGSAASVASLEVPIALGSDTGGSVRQPASLSGIVGIKPTYGRVSRYGLMAFGSSLDQIGIFAKNVEDTANTLEVIAGYDDNDPTTADVEVPDYSTLLDRDIKGLKIGLPKEYYTEDLDENIKKRINDAIEILVKMGAEVKEISLPYTRYATSTYYIISSAEAASNLSRYDGVRYGLRSSNNNIEDMYVKSRTEGFGKEVKRRIMIGNYVLSSGFYDAYYKKASQVRRLIKEDFEKALKEVDVIITPTSPTTAFKKGEKTSDPVQMYLADIYTVSISLAGLPAISIPVESLDGLPVGMQIISNYFREDLLFNVAYKYEKIRGNIQYPL